MLHFVWFRGDEYNRACRVWGKPDFIHIGWDRRAAREIAKGDTVVFARGDDGGLWVRHQVEFSDGRFEKIASAEPSLSAQDGLVEALEYARSQIIGLAVSGTDRIDELCRKLQKVDPSPIWPIPFPDPPERTWQPIVKRIDEALSAIKGDKS